MAIVLGASPAASDNKYEISPVEKAACTTDAIRLCSQTYPDQDRLMDCLRSNIPNLSLVCAVAFKAGMKKRGLHL